MLVPLILFAIAVICLSAPPTEPRKWAALIFALLALLVALTGWPPIHH